MLCMCHVCTRVQVLCACVCRGAGGGGSGWGGDLCVEQIVFAGRLLDFTPELLDEPLCLSRRRRRRGPIGLGICTYIYVHICM